MLTVDTLFCEALPLSLSSYYFLVVFVWFPEISRISSLKLLLWWLFKALQFNPGPPMLLPFVVGKNPSGFWGSVLFRSFWRQVFPVTLEAQPKLDPNCWVDLFSGQSLGSETHTFLWRGKVAPALVVLLCFCWVFLGRNGRNGMNMDMAIFRVVTIGYLARATLEVHRTSPCLSCIVSKFHHRNRHI